MPWVGAGPEALEAYRKASELKIDDAGVWAKLGMLLYDGRHYPEALAAMAKLSQGGPEWRFMGLVWQGHLLDLLGRREEAVACLPAGAEGAGRAEHAAQPVPISSSTSSGSSSG